MVYAPVACVRNERVNRDHCEAMNASLDALRSRHRSCHPSNATSHLRRRHGALTCELDGAVSRCFCRSTIGRLDDPRDDHPSSCSSCCKWRRVRNTRCTASLPARLLRKLRDTQRADLVMGKPARCSREPCVSSITNFPVKLAGRRLVDLSAGARTPRVLAFTRRARGEYRRTRVRLPRREEPCASGSDTASILRGR